MIELTETDGTPLKFALSQYKRHNYSYFKKSWFVIVCGVKHFVQENDEEIWEKLETERERLKTSLTLPQGRS